MKTRSLGQQCPCAKARRTLFDLSELHQNLTAGQSTKGALTEKYFVCFFCSFFFIFPLSHRQNVSADDTTKLPTVHRSLNFREKLKNSWSKEIRKLSCSLLKRKPVNNAFQHSDLASCQAGYLQFYLATFYVLTGDISWKGSDALQSLRPVTWCPFALFRWPEGVKIASLGDQQKFLQRETRESLKI